MNKSANSALKRGAVRPNGRVVVTGYPKSGNTWLVYLLADVLAMPKRDVYVNNDPKFAVYATMPGSWYLGLTDFSLTDHCVVKSHEYPQSTLTDFEAKFVHVVRDGRDVVVSKYFYDSEFCVKNRIYEQFDFAFEELPFDQYLVKVALEWRNFVFAWHKQSPGFIRYESLLTDTVGTLRSICQNLRLEVSEQAIREAAANNTADKMRAAMAQAYAHNTFVRKAIKGDWRNHFSQRDLTAFNEVAGDAMELLGYS